MYSYTLDDLVSLNELSTERADEVIERQAVIREALTRQAACDLWDVVHAPVREDR